MGTITYPHSIVDTDWFDANYVMDNFLVIKSAINGDLDESNLDAASDLVISDAEVSDNITTLLITPTSDMTLTLSELKRFTIGTGTSEVFSVDEDSEVVFDGVFQTFPIGTILMFDGTFVDNSTIPGWYICDGTDGAADLTDRFVMCSMTPDSTGGTNDAAVVEHTHTASTSVESATHTHTISLTSSTDTFDHTHSYAISSWNGSGSTWCTVYVDTTAHAVTSSASAWNHQHTFTSNVGDNDATHTHTLSLANEGDAAGTNMPVYYAMLYIQRIS